MHDSFKQSYDEQIGNLAIKLGLAKKEDVERAIEDVTRKITKSKSDQKRPSDETPFQLYESVIDLLIERGQINPDKLPQIDDEIKKTFASKPAPQLRPMTQVNRYILTSKIGRGGMGEVWRAWDPMLRTYVALKFLLVSLDETDLKRFLNEARTVAALDHPNIANVLSIDEWNGRHYIAMKFIKGKNLEKLRTEQVLKPQEICELVRDTAMTLDHAHSMGFIHRDIKPANIMVDATKRVYVMDFGLAKSVKSDIKFSRSDVIIGTLPYMSPEQVSGSPLDHRTDIYSLGVVLYELICGRLPFSHHDHLLIMDRIKNDEPMHPNKLDKTIDHDLAVITLKAMEKDPARRYQTARELAEDLDRYIHGEPISARPTSFIYKLKKKIRKNPVLYFSSASAIAIAIISFFMIQHFSSTSLEAESEKQKLLAQKIRLESATELMKRIDQFLAPAKLAIRKGDLNTRHNFEQALSILENEKSAFSHYFKGQIFVEMGKPKKALAELEQALKLDPDILEAKIERGLILAEKYEAGVNEFLHAEKYRFAARLNLEINWEEKWKTFATTEVAEKEIPELKTTREKLLADLSINIQESHFLPRHDILFARAILAFTNRNLADAKRLANETIRVLDSHHRAYSLLSRIALEENEIEEAINKIEISLKNHIGFAPSYVLLTNIYLQRGRMLKNYAEMKKYFLMAVESSDKAVKYGQDLAASHSAQQEAYLSLANVEKRIGRKIKLYDQAIKSCTEAINRNPKNFKLYYDRAFAIFSRATADKEALNVNSEQMKLVTVDLDQVMRLNPDSLVVIPFKEVYFIQAAQTLDSVGHALLFYDEAIKELTRLVDTFPSIESLYSRRANLFRLRGEYISQYKTKKQLTGQEAESISAAASYINAINDYMKYIEKSGTAKDFQLLGKTRLGLAKDSKSDKDETHKALNLATADLTKSITLDKDDADSYRIRASIYTTKAQSPSNISRASEYWQMALDDYNQIITLGKANSLDYLNRGDTRAELVGLKEAIKDYTKAIELDPQNSRAYTNRGFAYFQIDDILQSDADYIKSYNIQGLSFIEHFNFKNAIANFETALNFNPNNIETYLNLSKAQTLAHNFNDALKNLNKALSADKLNINVLKMRGSLYMELDNFTSALDDFNLALKQAKTEEEKSSILYLRGKCFMKSGNFEAATHDLSDYVDSKPKDPRGYILRGKIYRYRGKLDQALDNLTTAISLQEDSTEAFHERALVYWKNNKPNKALEDFTTALECDPSDKGSLYCRAFLNLETGAVNNALSDLLKNKQRGNSLDYFLLGNAQSAMKNYQDSIDSYTLAISLNPENKEAYAERAKNLKILGDAKTAAIDETKIKEIESALDNLTLDIKGKIINLTVSILSSPNDAKLYKHRGILRREIGEYQSSLRDLSKAVELDPQNPMLLMQRSITRLKLEDHHGAIRDLERASKLDTKNSMVYSMLSSAFASRDKEKYSEHESLVFAINYLTKAIELDTTNPFLYDLRGYLAHVLQDTLLAEADFNTAIKLTPWRAILYKNRAYLREKTGRLEDSLKDLEIALEKNPKLKEALEDRARIKNRLGKLDEAINDLSLLIKDCSDEYKYYLQRAELYRETKKYDEAIADLTSSIRFDRYSPPFEERAKVFRLKSDWLSSLADYNNAINFAGSSTYISKDKLSRLYLQRSEVWEMLDELEKALEDADKSVEFADNNTKPIAIAKRGLLKLKKGDDKGAESDFILVNNSHNPLPEALFKYAELIKKLNKRQDTLNIEWRANYLKGREFYSNKKYNDAVKYFSMAIDLKPKNIVTYLERGAVFLEMANVKRALEDFEIYLGESRDYTVLNYIGLARMASGETLDAIKSFKSALELKPFDADIVYNLGRAHAKLKDEKQALPHIKDAIAIGFRNVFLFETDPAFEHLRSNAEWKPIIHSLHILKTAEALPSYKGCNDYTIKSLTDLIKKSPDSDLLYFARGRIHMLSGHLKEAAKDFKSVLEKNPSFMHAQHLYGSILWQTNDQNEARKIFDKLEETAKDSPVSEFRLLYEAYSEEAYPEVIEVCNRLERAGLENIAHHIYLYRAIAKAGTDVLKNFDSILDDLKLIEKYDKNMAYYTYTTLANEIFTRHKKPELYNKLLDQAKNLMPHKREAYAYTGAFNFANPDKSRANTMSSVIRELETACSKGIGNLPIELSSELFAVTEKIVAGRNAAKLLPDETTFKDKELISRLPTYLINRGKILFDYYDYKDAEKDLTEALSFDPVNQQALIERAHTYIKLALFNAGLQDCTTVIRKNDKNGFAFTLRAECKYRLKDFKSAIEDATRAIELGPNDICAYGIRGASYFAQGKLDEALLNYDKAIEISPRYMYAYAEMARIYNQKKEFDDAIIIATEGIKNSSNSIGAALVYEARGRAYFAKMKWTLAQRDFEKALALDNTFELKLKPLIQECIKNKGS